MEILNTIVLALLTIAVIMLGVLVKSHKPNNPNSKVALAVMSEKLDGISRKLDNIISKLDEIWAGK